MNQSSDKALVDRVLAGDESAFRSLFQDHFSRLYRFALVRVNHNEDAAEEIAQATLCKALRKLETYRGEAPLFTWLCTFCRHELWARSKQQPRVERIEDSPEIRAVLESLEAGEAWDPELQLNRTEAAWLVRITLDHLPTRYGNVLEWKYLRGLSVKEIASRLGIGAKAAESTLTRARNAFRDAFTEIVLETAKHKANGSPSPLWGAS